MWTHIADFDRRTGLVALEPSKRQPLRSADVRAMRVDSAAAALVEESAASGLAGRAPLEQRLIVSFDDGCFDFEDREAVHAAVGAASSACKPVTMKRSNGGYELVYDAMQSLHQIDDVISDVRDASLILHAAPLARPSGAVEFDGRGRGPLLDGEKARNGHAQCSARAYGSLDFVSPEGSCHTSPRECGERGCTDSVVTGRVDSCGG